MTIGQKLQQTTQILDKTSPTARLDALLLLADELNKDKAWILAHLDELMPKLSTSFTTKVERRSKHEPIAYIRGKCEFFGYEFAVSPDTLQPRPETETMIEQAKQLALKDGDLVADIGTGSGAIAITLKLESPSLEIVATEINQSALKIAKKNQARHRVDVQFLQGDLLKPIKDRPIEVILANLPYVPDSHTINKAAMQEPKVAIFGGPDGLDIYRKLFEQIQLLKRSPKWVLTESLPPQHQKLAKIAGQSGYKLQKTDDFIQIFVAN